MPCDKIVKPELTPEQIAECQKCKFISRRKRWCCKIGFWVIEPSRIIQPKRGIIQPARNRTLPDRKIIKPPSLADMAIHFTKAMAQWAKKGFKTVDKTEYIKRRTICSECQPTGRCPHCGCYLWAKVALVTEKCPEGKWG